MLDAVFVAIDRPNGVLAAVSERGTAPPETPSPTGVLARRFADSLGYPKLPIVRATQVHGARVVTVEEKPAPGEIVDAGACDALVTRLPGVGLAIQAADCVPVLLTAPGAIGAAHAGWRGAAANVAGAAAEALLALTDDPGSVRAWLGPAIGVCCYEVGSEVASQFSGEFVRASGDGRYRLDLPAVVRSQLNSAGLRPENVAPHPSCTMCGGERFASYRRDRENAGRMIALVARFHPASEDVFTDDPERSAESARKESHPAVLVSGGAPRAGPDRSSRGNGGIARNRALAAPSGASARRRHPESSEDRAPDLGDQTVSSRSS